MSAAPRQSDQTNCPATSAAVAPGAVTRSLAEAGDEVRHEEIRREEIRRRVGRAVEHIRRMNRS